MKTMPVYAANFATHMENALRDMQSSLSLTSYTPLPTTTQEMKHYIEHLLTKDEQSVCDKATD